MKLEGIMLSEISHPKEKANFVSLCIQKLKRKGSGSQRQGNEADGVR